MVHNIEQKIWQTAIKLIREIKDNGYEAYFVGGCVRDLLLKRESQDIDIATSALPEEVMEIFPKTIPIGLAHGTVMIVYHDFNYEVTTFRKETTYSNRRHPDAVYFIRNLEDDLKRRDFTINAMAMDDKLKLIDLFNGEKDLERKLVKTVGDPIKRFNEDALRMLRAIRFVSQLGFKIEDKTFQSVINLNESIKYIAIERIKIEVEKLLMGDYAPIGAPLLIQSKLFENLPIFKYHPTMATSILNLNTSFTNFSCFIAYMHIYHPEVSINQWIEAWKCSNKEMKLAKNISANVSLYEREGLTAWLVYMTYSFENEFLNVLTVLDSLDDLFQKDYNRIKNNLTIQSKDELAIDGNDLLELFPHARRGKWIKSTLQSIEKRVVMGYLQNQKEKIKEWIKWHPPVKD